MPDQTEPAPSQALLTLGDVCALAVALAEDRTGKHGTDALAALVRQRRLTADGAGRIWAASGRQDAPRAEMTIADYRTRYGFRQPPMVADAPRGPVNNSVCTGRLAASYEADITHHPEYVALIKAGRYNDASALAARLTAERERSGPVSQQERARLENLRYHAEIVQRNQLSQAAAAMRARHPGTPPQVSPPPPA